MQERCCYLNSYALAAQQPDRFTYFEGYASTVRSQGCATAHAWCVDRDRRVVDATWANLKSDRPAAYLGLPIPLDVAKPYAYFESHGAFDGWLRKRREEMPARVRGDAGERAHDHRAKQIDTRHDSPVQQALIRRSPGLHRLD